MFLLIVLVAFVTYMHSLDKKWALFPWLRKKEDEEEEEEKRKETAKDNKN